MGLQVGLVKGRAVLCWSASAGPPASGVAALDPDRVVQACREAVHASAPRGRDQLVRGVDALERAVFGDAAVAPGSVARRLIFDGERLVAWVGLCLPGEALREEALCRCNAHRAELARGLTQADRRARVLLPVAEGDVLLRGDGVVSHASPVGRAWLAAPDVARGLSTLLRSRAERGWPASALREQIEGAAVELTRLEGEGDARVHVRLCPVEPLRLRIGAQLTPRQREVGDFAAAGATVPQIASATGLSSETVRTHLRAIYARLQVASRVELAEALRVEVGEPGRRPGAPPGTC